MIFKMFSKNQKKEIDTTPKVMTKIKKEKIKVKPTRIGELGEYKINIQLDQLPKTCHYLSDLLLPNPKSMTGYSQIDHVILCPFAIFVIETKNYAGTIYGDNKRKQWSVNGKITITNPFHQNFGHVQAIRSILVPTESSNFISMVSFTRRCTFKVNPELRNIQSNDLIVYDTELTDFIQRKLNVLKLQKQKAMFSEDEIRSMYNKLHEENISDYEQRKKHVEIIKGKNNSKEASSSHAAKTATCKVCGKHVSQKVEAFCLNNKKRFKGDIYCFDHQTMN